MRTGKVGYTCAFATNGVTGRVEWALQRVGTFGYVNTSKALHEMNENGQAAFMFTAQVAGAQPLLLSMRRGKLKPSTRDTVRIRKDVVRFAYELALSYKHTVKKVEIEVRAKSKFGKRSWCFALASFVRLEKNSWMVRLSLYQYCGRTPDHRCTHP